MVQLQLPLSLLVSAMSCVLAYPQYHHSIYGVPVVNTVYGPPPVVVPATPVVETPIPVAQQPIPVQPVVNTVITPSTSAVIPPSTPFVNTVYTPLSSGGFQVSSPQITRLNFRPTPVVHSAPVDHSAHVAHSPHVAHAAHVAHPTPSIHAAPPAHSFQQDDALELLPPLQHVVGTKYPQVDAGPGFRFPVAQLRNPTPPPNVH